MLLRSTIILSKNFVCSICRAVVIQNCSYSDKLETNYSEEQKQQILQVLNESNGGSLTRYDISKTRVKHINKWKINNGNLKSLSDIDMVEGFSDKYAVKLFDSILKGPMEEKNDDTKAIKKIKGTILHPILQSTLRQNCKSVLALFVSVNCICWTLIDRTAYEVLQWKFHGIDYPDSKKFQISDIMNIAWRVTRSLPPADICVMKAEATTLRASGSDPNNPKVLAVNLQKAQLISMIVALINARSNQTSNNEDGGYQGDADTFNNVVYFLRPNLPYRLFGTLVGNEKVSTDQTVEMILQSIGNKPNDNSRVYIPERIINSFRNQKDMQKDMLGHCLLLALTFMDICIYKKKDSIEKLSKRGD